MKDDPHEECFKLLEQTQKDVSVLKQESQHILSLSAITEKQNQEFSDLSSLTQNTLNWIVSTDSKWQTYVTEKLSEWEAKERHLSKKFENAVLVSSVTPGSTIESFVKEAESSMNGLKHWLAAFTSHPGCAELFHHIEEEFSSVLAKFSSYDSDLKSYLSKKDMLQFLKAQYRQISELANSLSSLKREAEIGIVCTNVTPAEETYMIAYNNPSRPKEHDENKLDAGAVFELVGKLATGELFTRLQNIGEITDMWNPNVSKYTCYSRENSDLYSERTFATLKPISRSQLKLLRNEEKATALRYLEDTLLNANPEPIKTTCAIASPLPENVPGKIVFSLPNPSKPKPKTEPFRTRGRPRKIRKECDEPDLKPIKIPTLSHFLMVPLT